MFTGFTPETFDFLWGIRMNNNREWFLPHKQQYIDALYRPMQALGQDLFQPFLEKSGAILKVSRIYRDARLHDPDPYKESLWLCIRQDCDWWAENPCLFFEIRPEGVSYGFSLWQPKIAVMNDFRQYAAGHMDEFLALVRNAEQATAIPVTAECYKKPRTDSPLPQPYASWRRDISCIRTEEVGENLFTPALAVRVAEMFHALTPLYDYFQKFSG